MYDWKQVNQHEVWVRIHTTYTKKEKKKKKKKKKNKKKKKKQEEEEGEEERQIQSPLPPPERTETLPKTHHQARKHQTVCFVPQPFNHSGVGVHLLASTTLANNFGEPSCKTCWLEMNRRAPGVWGFWPIASWSIECFWDNMRSKRNQQRLLEGNSQNDERIDLDQPIDVKICKDSWEKPWYTQKNLRAAVSGTFKWVNLGLIDTKQSPQISRVRQMGISPNIYWPTILFGHDVSPWWDGEKIKNNFQNFCVIVSDHHWAIVSSITNDDD